MLGHASEEREGALLRRLKDASHGGRPGRLGFATGEGGGRRRAMVIMARVAHGPAMADEVLALAEAGADGIEIAVRDGGDAAGLADIVRSVEIPCGVFVPVAEGKWTAITSAEGIDWIHLAAPAPARLLAGKGKGPTRLVSLSTDEPPGRLAGLVGLQADAIVVENPAGRTALTVDTLLALCTIQAATKRPLLAGSSVVLDPDDVAVLHDHGIEGVLLGADTATIRAFVKAVEALAQ